MEFDFITYIESIATSSVYIKHTESDIHFGIASGYTQVEALLRNSVSPDRFQIIAIDDTSGNFDNSDDVNLFDNQHYAFMLVKHVDYQDMIKRKTAIADCKLMMRRIIKKMAHDQYIAATKANIFDTIGLRNLNQNSFKYFTVGPIADNFVGLQISFTAGESLSAIKYDEDDWT